MRAQPIPLSFSIWTRTTKRRVAFKALFSKAHKLPALESWTYDKLLGISLESSADVILADLALHKGIG